MNRPLSIVTILLISAFVSRNDAVAADMKALTMEGKGVMMSFARALKGELVGAMKSGGPGKALKVCNIKAPAIAAMASKKSGWTVARSSHKLRNPTNKPDAFTAAAIKDFLDRIGKGEKAEKLIKTAIVEENGKKVFRLVKAIPTKGVCLKCHGSSVKPEVLKKIKALYPEDQATGFRPGQMRGVFTLSKTLN